MDPKTSIDTPSASGDTKVDQTGTVEDTAVASLNESNEAVLAAFTTIPWAVYPIDSDKFVMTAVATIFEKEMAIVVTPSGFFDSRPVDELEDVVALLGLALMASEIIPALSDLAGSAQGYMKLETSPALLAFAETLKARMEEIPFLLAGYQRIQEERLLAIIDEAENVDTVADDAESGESVGIRLNPEDDSATGDAEVSAGSDEDQSTATGAGDSDTSGGSAEILEMPHDESGKASDEVGTAPASEDSEKDKVAAA